MISKETVMQLANVLNLTILKENEKYAVFNYKNIEVCLMSWSPDKLSYVHQFVKVSTEVLFNEDKIDYDVKIYWGGTNFMDISDEKTLTEFVNRLKKLCENIDKAIKVSKQMTSASKIAVIEGE
jgi:hypothetical protein